MLTDGKHECVIKSEAGTLRLSNIKVMALSMWGRV
jgi:hypothetical protein